MRLTYLLDRPELGGGTKVVGQHADLLAQRGHDVTLVAEGPRPPWLAGSFRYLESTTVPSELPPQDLVLATFWTTIERAERLARGPVAHFCQGFEMDLEHLEPDRPAIEAAYRRPLPALVVAPHLGERLRREFARPSRLAPPPVVRGARARWKISPGRSPRIALFGIFEARVKGIATALEAIAALRARGRELRLVRISVLPETEGERRLAPADRYLCGVTPDAALRVLATCDLLLFPSRSAEGFGLPLLEAMALGVPAVASRIASTEFMTQDTGARLVEADDAAAFAREALALLSSASAWRRQRRAGLVAARRFAPRRVAGEVESAVAWARAEAVR